MRWIPDFGLMWDSLGRAALKEKVRPVWARLATIASRAKMAPPIENGSENRIVSG